VTHISDELHQLDASLDAHNMAVNSARVSTAHRFYYSVIVKIDDDVKPSRPHTNFKARSLQQKMSSVSQICTPFRQRDRAIDR